MAPQQSSHRTPGRRGHPPEVTASLLHFQLADRSQEGLRLFAQLRVRAHGLDVERQIHARRLPQLWTVIAILARGSNAADVQLPSCEQPGWRESQTPPS